MESAMNDVYPIPEFLRKPVEAPRERPILFSAPMIKALFAGAKTQTRRAVKPQPPYQPTLATHLARRGYPVWHAEQWQKFCPYGQPGDRLWVRETCRAHEITDSEADNDTFRLGLEQPPYGLDGVIYRADGSFRAIENTREASDAWATMHSYRGKRGATVPPIHMPRWASRILLEIVAVRVEKLQDISEADAKAEGSDPVIVGGIVGSSYREGYAQLWDSINGPGAWSANPFVWVLEFRRVKP